MDKSKRGAARVENRGRAPSRAESELAQLVCRMAKGDSQALSELYDATSGVAYTLALRVLRLEADAEEVTLDAYTKAWRKASEYDARRGGVLAWLTIMTRTLAIDRLRSNAARGANRREEWTDLAAPASDNDSPERESILAQRRARVRNALQSLPAEQRQVLECAYFSGLSHSEMSERLGIPLGTVKTRARLGLVRLQQYLEGLD